MESDAKFGPPIIKVSSTNISEQLQITKPGVNSRLPGLIVIYSPTCIHCKMMEPEYLKGAKITKGQVQFLSLNGKIKTNERLIKKLGITSYPTILKIKNGFITNTKFNKNRTAEDFYKFATS